MAKNFNGLYLDCATSQEAWEKINEYIFLNEKLLKKVGGGRDGNACISYDNHIYIRKAWVNPEFDFGKIFGYRIQKWSHLVNNYVDLNVLDIIKTDINSRESKKQRVYNVTKHFNNSHENGKDCLISLTFSRRLYSDIPILVFHTRATEVTKRLLIDFLLIQRIGEYIYGNNDFSIILYSPMAYVNVEAFTMYHLHNNLNKLIRPYKGNLQPFQERVLYILNKFLKCKPTEISYKSHRRAVKQLQSIDDNGNPSSKKLLAKGLVLTDYKYDYPDDCITNRQRLKFRKQLKKDKY